MNPEEEHEKAVNMTGLATTFGLELAALVVGAAFLGDWLEHTFQSGTWMTLVTVGAACTLFCLHIAYTVRQYSREDSDQDLHAQ